MSDAAAPALTEEQLRRAAVWGAYFALQVHARVESGLGPPDEETCKRYAEEATAVVENVPAMKEGD